MISFFKKTLKRKVAVRARARIMKEINRVNEIYTFKRYFTECITVTFSNNQI